MEILLHAFMQRDDLHVLKMSTQTPVPNLYGREVRFDAFATDADGTNYNLEVQRTNIGAVGVRARYNSSMLDVMSVEKGTSWRDLPKNVVIFITEHDIWGKRLPLYHVRRHLEELDYAPFDDGAEIIYANAAYQGDDALGRLMHDFRTANPDEMYCTALADRVRFFKTNEKGVSNMCEIMDAIYRDGEKMGMERGLERGLERGREQGMARGIENERLAQLKKLMDKLHFSLDEALDFVDIPAADRARYTALLKS